MAAAGKKLSFEEKIYGEKFAEKCKIICELENISE